MTTVVAIWYHELNSWNGRDHIMAVAENDEAAMRWLQDEVDEKHSNGTSYMQGETAQWWINYGTFSLKPMELHS